MKRRAWDSRIIALLIGSYLAPQVSTAHEPSVEYHVFTSTELVQAIDAANSGTAPAVIFLFPREYVLSDTFDSEFGVSTLPPIKSNITLVGRNTATTILRGGRMFTVLAGGRLTVRNVTLTGGRGADTDEPFPNGGGAAANFHGFLRFQDCVLKENQAAASEFGSEQGGAILSVGGRLEVVRTTISDNSVSAGGAGIALFGGSGVVRDSIITRNRVFGGFGNISGGGIRVSSGATLGIYGSTVADNVVLGEIDDLIGFGDGIAIGLSTIVIADSAVVRNIAGTDGAGAGGGIFNAGNLTIKNGTIGGNRAGTSGGGVFNQGSLKLQGVTVVDNEAAGLVMTTPTFDRSFPPECTDQTPELCLAGGGGVWNEPAGRVVIAGSVVANNLATSNSDTFPTHLGPDCKGAFISQGHNAIGDDLDCVLKPAVKGTNTHDLVNVDPRLAALADDGAAGNAHYPLRAGSPLIDAGDIVGPRCTFVDQLGQRRVDGDQEGNVSCDIGAIEFQH